jgi:hypothetical protein
MPTSPIFTDEEIVALAQILKPPWRPGQLVMPWLRANADMLQALVQEEHWSADHHTLHEATQPWKDTLVFRLSIRLSINLSVQLSIRLVFRHSRVVIFARPVYSVPMPTSPIFTDEEIVALGQILKPLWRPGQLVMPWLRANADMLRALVQEEHWSWNAVAAAMTKAGITYRTGNAWSGTTLRLQIRQARQPLKKQAAVRGPIIVSPATKSETSETRAPTGAPIATATAVVSDAGAAKRATARFKAFTLKPYEPPPKLTPEEAAEKAVLENRFFGKP